MSGETKPLSQFYELLDISISTASVTICMRYKWDDPRWGLDMRGSMAIIMAGLTAVVDAALPYFSHVDTGIACSIFHSDDNEICIPSLPLDWWNGIMLQWHIEMCGETLDVDDTFKFEFRF
jgi:hypothetical protein